MRRLMKLQWHDLRSGLLLLDDAAAPEEIFRTLVGGFRKYRTQFCSQPFACMRFARYFSMQAADYPVAQSTMRDDEFRHVKQCIERYEVKDDLYSIMALLSDTMERLVTLRSDACCPACAHRDFATCKVVVTGELVMGCAVCFHVQDRHGARYTGGPLTFASAADLQLPGRAPAPGQPLPPHPSPRIRVDAGAMVDYKLIALSCRDAETDSARILHAFYRGMRVAIFDDDTDELGQPGHVIAGGHAEPASAPPRWAPLATWLCRIDSEGMRRAPQATPVC